MPVCDDAMREGGVGEEGARETARVRAARAVERFRFDHRLGYGLIVFACCGLVYFAVLEGFLAIPLFNGSTQIRPASGLGPVFGLFFGWPAALGCALGNLVSDILHEGVGPGLLVYYFFVQIVYDIMPYYLWYLVNRNRAFPFPRLDSTVKVATFLAAMALDAVLVVLLTSSSVPSTMEALNVYAVRSLNNVLFLFYLGIPLLLLLERSPLWPLAPRFVRVAYQKRPRMNLTQRFVVLLTFVMALFVVAFVSISYTGYLLEGVVGFADIVASAYVSGSVLSVVMFVPMLLLLAFIEKRFTRPIEVLTAASRTFAAQVEAHEAGEGPLDVPAIDLQGIHPQLEVADLFESTSKMRADLVDYIDRLARATSERERSRAELDIARQIQQGVVPHEFTSFTERYHLNIDGFMRPAREVGGDFYDVFDVGEQGVAFVVGDVSDKGVPAALFMMRAQSLIREQLLVCRDLGTAFTVVNRMLCDRNDALLFVTAFACVLDTSTGRVDYVNAGHNPPSLLSEGRRDFLRAKPGLVLGALETASYRTRSIDLKPGDGLVLYTDGATEARDASGALYGEGRLADVLARLDAEGATDVLRRVVGDIDAFAGDEPQADDITLLSFSWNLPVERIVLPPEDRYLDELFAFLEPLCAHEGCTSKMLFELKLVCEELFVNVCHYGFPNDQPRLSVVVEAAVDDRGRRLHLTMSDQGIPYDPLAYDSVKVEAGKDNRVGGLGILLVRKYVDDIAYERVAGKNVLRMTKEFV